MYCFDCICIGEVLVRCWFNKWFNSTEIPWVKYICEFFFKKKEKIAESSTKCKMLHEMCSIMKKITWIPGGIHLLSFVCFFFCKLHIETAYNLFSWCFDLTECFFSQCKSKSNLTIRDAVYFSRYIQNQCET